MSSRVSRSSGRSSSREPSTATPTRGITSVALATTTDSAALSNSVTAPGRDPASASLHVHDGGHVALVTDSDRLAPVVGAFLDDHRH